jgi:branched-subunit amino acid transport protein
VNIWLVMLIGGLITFGMRFSLIYLFGRFQVPETMRRALHYVPPAVLSAIVFPELLLQDGMLNLSLDNFRLMAGLVAVMVAWFSKNTLLTIIQGWSVVPVAIFFMDYRKIVNLVIPILPGACNRFFCLRSAIDFH